LKLFQRYHALGPIYYRNSDGALLVYDVTDQDSFTRVQHWVKELRKVVGDDIVITIAGNKCDLKKKVVEESEALSYCEKVGASHIYTSAKANKGVEEAFLDLTKRILKQKEET
jgi:Ras-related protein Rab-21